MTHTPDENESSTPSETDADPTATGADAVPDKTADTPAKGAEFEEDHDSSNDDTSDIPGAGADTSIRDQE